jgi:hypothetical protein
MAELRRLHPDWNIYLMLPLLSKMKFLTEEDFAVSEMIRIADRVLAIGLDNQLYSMRTLRTARRFARPQHLLRRVSKHRPLRFLKALNRRLPAWLCSILRASGDPPEPATRGLLVEIQGRRRVEGLLREFLRGPRLSVSHGLSPHFAPSSGIAGLPGGGTHERRVFAASEREAAYFSKQFGLRSEQVVVTGIPRHDPDAIRYLRTASSALHDIPFARVVFLISRAANDSWLSQEIKAAAVRAVHDFCKDVGLALVARCHPSESETDLRAALPKDEEGSTWMTSEAHPLQIGQHAEFAVSFHSGLPIEMLTVGVPTIEFQLGGFGGQAAERANGLVIAADSVDEFRAAAAQILSDKARVTSSLIASKERLYASSEGAVRKIVSELEACTVRQTV